MNPILKALLMLGAVITIGGQDYPLFIPRPTTTIADMVDAGVGSCPQRVLTCHFRAGQGIRNRLADAGYVLRSQQRHITASSRIAVCGNQDAGFEGLSLAFRRLLYNENDDDGVEIGPEARCQLRTFAQYGSTPGIREIIVEQPPCRRRIPGQPACTTLDGGGPGVWNVFPASALTGAQCQPVECSVTFGEDPDVHL